MPIRRSDPTDLNPPRTARDDRLCRATGVN